MISTENIIRGAFILLAFATVFVMNAIVEWVAMNAPKGFELIISGFGLLIASALSAFFGLIGDLKLILVLMAISTLLFLFGVSIESGWGLYGNSTYV